MVPHVKSIQKFNTFHVLARLYISDIMLIRISIEDSTNQFFDFLITFGSFKFTPLINIEDYVGFFTKIMFGFGIAFELPIFAYFLALLGMIDDRMMRDFFKYAVVIIFIVAALLTPPDVLTQMLMAGPLIILYGFSILIVRLVNPAPPLEEEDEDEEEVNLLDELKAINTSSE